MRGLVLLASILLVASPAQAAESSAKPTQPFLKLQAVGLPAVVQGRLVNYVFVEMQLTLAWGVDPARLQDQEPFLRDALVRAAAKHPYNLPGDGVRLDDRRLKADVLAQANATFGPGKVVGVQIKSETPQRRTGVPGGAAA